MNQKSEKTDTEFQESRELLYQLPNGEKITIEIHEIKKDSNWKVLIEYYIQCQKFSESVHNI